MVDGNMLSQEVMIEKLKNPALWTRLKNRDDPEVQQNAAREFKDLLWSFSPHLSVGSASRRQSEWSALLVSMDEGLKECVFSTFPHEILGGILLIRAVISVVTEWMEIGEGLSEFVSRYATYLREIMLKCHLHDDRYRARTWSVIAVCTECLGEVVSVSGNGAKSMVERDIKTMLKWIGGSSVSIGHKVTVSEQHKVAAVWLLAEYAVSVPIFFNLEIDRIVKGIVTAIRDESPLVRKGGIKVLRECLLAISKRPHREKIQLSSRIVTDGYQGLLQQSKGNKVTNPYPGTQRLCLSMNSFFSLQTSKMLKIFENVEFLKMLEVLKWFESLHFLGTSRYYENSKYFEILNFYQKC